MQQYKLGEGPYGSAYQGTIDDLLAAGDLAPIEAGGRTFGLFLGHFDWQQTFKHTWDKPARGVLKWLMRARIDHEYKEVLAQTTDLRFSGDQHHLIVASSGAGKFRDVLSNMLLFDGSCETACLIIDPKGEIAQTIGPMIDEPDSRDPRTVLIDPWDLCGTGHTDALTLLDGIRADSPHCVKDARVLADAIIIERGKEDGHWTATAKNFLAALILYVALDPLEADSRTLFRLREIVTLPWADLVDLLGYMSEIKLFENLISRAANAMLNRDEKERRSIFSTLERDTAFIEDPSLWKAIKTSTIDINQLVLTNKRLHIVIPFDYTQQMSSWLRLTIAAFYNACLRHRLDRKFPRYLQFRHIIIDEFAGLGKLDFIMKDIAEARGAGIKYHLVVQNFAQLRDLYGEGWENIVSNSMIHAFGVTENFTAEYLSKMTGQSTVVTQSSGVSNSTSNSWTRSNAKEGDRSHSYSESKGTSFTYSSTGRAVLMPDEIRRMPGDRQLLFLRQLPVLMSRRTPYFETFKRFLPQHTLRDILLPFGQGGRQRALPPFSMSGGQRLSPLIKANAVYQVPRFVPPESRPYTFKKALADSPLVLMAAVLLVGYIGLQVMSAISNAHREEAAREEAIAQSQRNARAAAQAAAAAAEREAAARVVDAALLPRYTQIAASVMDSINRQQMCSAETGNNSAFICSGHASYANNTLNPVNLNLSFRRMQFFTLSLSTTNANRDYRPSGYTAQFTIKSVSNDVGINSTDGGAFGVGSKTVINSLLKAFDIDYYTLNKCFSGLDETINNTRISCRYTGPDANSERLRILSLSLFRESSS